MTEKVCADTIQAMTIAAAFNAAAAGPAPDAQTMINDIRRNLTAEVARFTQAVEEESKNGTTLPTLEMALRYARLNLQKFEKMMKEVPHGFRLVPVLYSRIGDDQKKDAYREFSEKVRYEFMHFLTENHMDELKALGIGPRGIARMRNGGSPVNEDGLPLNISVDHIIERGGGGQLTLQEAIDPQLPPDKGQILLVNHLSNFILLPEQIHEYKNELNKLQCYQDIPPNSSKWILMMVPEVSPDHSGYVAQPQPPEHPLAGLISREQADIKKIKSLDAKIDSLCTFLKAFHRDRRVVDMLAEVENLNFWQKQPNFRGKRRAVSSLFNRASPKYPEQMKILNTQLYPALNEILMGLRDLFQKVERLDKNYKHYAELKQMYTKYEMNELRRIFVKFPTRRTVLFMEDCKRMDAILRKAANSAPPKRPPLAA